MPRQHRKLSQASDARDRRIPPSGTLKTLRGGEPRPHPLRRRGGSKRWRAGKPKLRAALGFLGWCGVSTAEPETTVRSVQRKTADVEDAELPAMFEGGLGCEESYLPCLCLLGTSLGEGLRSCLSVPSPLPIEILSERRFQQALFSRPGHLGRHKPPNARPGCPCWDCKP